MVNLADKFITALGTQELFPALHNSTLFVQTSGWNTEKYYGKCYSDKTPFPLLITVKGNDGVMFIPVTKAKKLSQEVFMSFWANESTLSERLKHYEQETKVIDDLYSAVTEEVLKGKEFSNLTRYIEEIRDAAWNMNTLAFFSIYFDKEMCVGLLSEVGSAISSKRLDAIWHQGITPISKSFEKRRESYVLELLEDEKGWGEIAIKCQYFGANYNKVSSVAEVEAELKEKFSQFEKTEDRRNFISDEKVKEERKASEYAQWLMTLSSEEKKLVHYLQTIIELRDARKDYLAKFLVVVFRIAQKLFQEAGLDEKLIYFYTLDEIIKGKAYLLENKTTLESRLVGCTVFVGYDGVVEIEYGTFDATKSKVEKFFLTQQGEKVDESIKGQIGSPGKVRGVVKVILNVEKESGKFNQGDILVTGMTRPEFVPLMKKAAAVVTDEGGITCHAAIVAREMKKPCVIGTKIASKVLKDGDEVEVDADNGIVRIIRKNK